MRILSRQVASGLLRFGCATLALAVTSTTMFAGTAAPPLVRPLSDPGLYAIAGSSLILFGLLRSRRRKD